MNFFRTGLLLAALTAFFLAVGYLLGGQSGLVIALVAALGMNLFAYWNSDKMVLRMSNAQEVGPDQAPELYGIVQGLAQRAGLPMPRVYLIDEEQPNAFATGRDPEHAAVAATTGLLRHLSREEITGVMAHELSHVRHRDTLTMTIAATLAGAIGMLASFGGLMGGGRDQNGRPLANPIVAIAAMILAPLAKLQAGTQQIPNQVAEAHPTTAHLYIANPLSAGGLRGLFSTHPPMEERIARLEAMAGAYRPAAAPPPPQTSPWGAAPQAPRRGPWG
jgi:heat shock protein HtpX